MLTNRPSFKSGAASFYIVAISTLILVILATSFATAIISEIIRSSNDDLAQSAYDSAMAGVEEAKLAYANYRNCINMYPALATTSTSLDSSTDSVTCQDIVYWVQHPSCDMVAHILGRIGKTGNTKKQDEIGEISLEQTSTGRTNSELDQAYTCVEIYTDPQNIYGTLNIANPYKIVKLKTEAASTVDTITLRWHMNEGNLDFAYTNIANNKVAFQPIGKADTPTPATIAFQIIQTPNIGFTFDQLNGKSTSSASDHMTMFFVPTGDKNLAKSSTPVTNTSTYVGLYNESTGVDGLNFLSDTQIASTNNHEKNYPYLVYCDSNKLDDFACSVEMELPKPVGGNNRANETFSFIVSLPYGGPATTFSVDFTCNGQACVFTNEYENDGSTTAIDTTQVVIDSTGRANDMYKRVEVRLDTEVSAILNGYPFYAIQADTIEKNFSVNTEWGVEMPEEPEPEPEEPQIATCAQSGVPIMQNWTGASSLGTHATTLLCDDRDGTVYPVIKMKDGHVWLQKNFRLNLADPNVSITSENTNNPASDFTQLIQRYPQIENVDAFMKQCVAFTGGGSYNHHQICYYAGYLGNTKQIPGDPSHTYDDIGVYYNWNAAVAGNIDNTYSNGNVKGDICPKGWHLPTKDDFTKMFSSEIGPLSWKLSTTPGRYGVDELEFKNLQKLPLNYFKCGVGYDGTSAYNPGSSSESGFEQWLGTKTEYRSVAYGGDFSSMSDVDIGNIIRCISN